MKNDYGFHLKGVTVNNKILSRFISMEELPVQRIKLFPSSGRYWKWFEINEKKYVINLHQNILFYFFPFLLYLMPLNCYEIESDADLKRVSQLKKANVPFIYIGCSSGLMELISKMKIGIIIPPIISVVLAIIVGISITNVIKTDNQAMQVKIVRKEKIRIHPCEFGESLKMLFCYCFIILVLGTGIRILYDNSNNIFWFCCLVLWIYFISIGTPAFVRGQLKIKFLDCD